VVPEKPSRLKLNTGEASRGDLTSGLFKYETSERMPKEISSQTAEQIEVLKL
jgi:hypothetical protein